MSYYTRVGRRNKYHYKWSVWILTVVILITFIFFRQIKVAEVKGIEADTYKGQLNEITQTKDQRLEQLTRENEALRIKLAGEYKVEPSTTVRKLVQSKIKQYFGEDAPTAERIFTCESGLNPLTVHVNRPGLGTDSGVSQLNDRFHKARFEAMFGVPFEVGAFDIDTNLKYAKYLYDTSNWGVWVCSRIVGI